MASHPPHTDSLASGPDPDWRTDTLAEVRRLILAADPEMIEECKWIKPTNPAGVPVWSHAGIVCTGETYKQVVKVTFARGAALADPHGLFNASLEGNTRRAIDIRQGETLDAVAFTALIQAAVAENLRIAEGKAQRSPRVKKPAPTTVQLLAGGNPQIPKGDGDGPVQAYIAAMPGWKHQLGKRLDELIQQAVPDVQKAVRWNSPFYGVAGQGWFVSFHVFNRYVKVTFFAGTALQPIPPGGTVKSGAARWIDIYETDPLDESQFCLWIRQAAVIPGWIP